MKFKDTFSRDLFWLVARKKLGEGMSRKVYSMSTSNETVLKVEHRNRFQNILEWEIWDEIRYTKWKKWFAPCYEISPNGMFLIQHKTEPIPKKELPDKMPVFLNDFKASNYGYIVENGRKRIVCHDYGIVSLIGDLSDRMKKVTWNFEE